MISLLGSLLGFGSSLVGPILETWNKNSDEKHELVIFFLKFCDGISLLLE